MKLQFFCPRWGSEQMSWDHFLQKVKDTGYDGVEFGIAAGVPHEELVHIWELLTQYGLPVIVQHYDTYEADFNAHYDRYAAWLEKMRPFKCVRINSQTGKDFFTFEQNKLLIDLAAKFSDSSGIEVLHETHRNKFSFAAHVTKNYLEHIPSLRITLDASHWVNVSESYLDDQQEAMTLAISRAEHLHARVGFPEGPQVPDPRVPEWQEALAAHLRWWDRLVDRKKDDNAPVLTITPEFGPYPYMQVLPFTRQPVANQWEINEYMMNLLKRRYS